MGRRRAIGMVAGLVLMSGATGCMTEGEWTLQKVLGWDDPANPRPVTISPASLQNAERVEQLGRKILAHNPFTGIDPLFYTIGVPEPALFHRGTGELCVSEGLVKQCKAEGQLAAVLCSELGLMISEKRLALEAGHEKDSIPEVAETGERSSFDANAVEVGSQKKSDPREAPGSRNGKPSRSTDSTDLAKELLRGAGFDPAELDRIGPLLKQSDRGAILRKQLAGSAPAPKWDP